MFSFELLAKEDDARTGRLVTPHGTIETPSFVPVGTQATVKAVSMEDLRKIGSQVMITNAYHLHLQPGEDLIERMGGLHRFMGWDGPLMTDSGGFQIFSLGAGKAHGVGKIAPIFPEEKDRGRHLGSKKGKSLVRVDEDGVEFISYLDGSRHRFTPEGVMEIERKLGADIILVLDECTSPLHDYHYTRDAMERTHRWSVRALEACQRTSNRRQAILGIVQGGAYQDLRQQSATFIADQGFDGYAIGGSLGKSKEEMYQVLEWTIPLLPQDKPRHLLGIGEIEDIFEVVKRGVDLFDCVVPTRTARTGTLFAKGAERCRIHILNAQFKDDPRPIEEGCHCHTCCNYSKAYLRHLFLAKELSAIRLATIHNLYFIESLMHQIRAAIKEGRLATLKQEWLSSS
ncbi:MAG: tRNA guanosine(34) transglycosylase Tgt [Deltaproteobacteria bacterium]|nr:tRNA guanosine(34) transglycosylase Tgt [Deltaproteobacteria bacterium]MBW2019615.1 tRNA guanosine(34) transglycosylase Tgt [Deltaproteobacteria bacterium]MBW2074430.1 tRNA guanosine(34) transglycosylase Tgt [Deltaproteobacteria bacterium]RLB82371.1 MAG: tRNA guanosine(34) transglycosylase Tgt [Deltaproteobacteria bacterium]